MSGRLAEEGVGGMRRKKQRNQLMEKPPKQHREQRGQPSEGQKTRNMLSSMQKLVDLEQRISHLEGNNAQKRMRKGDKELSFKSKKADGVGRGPRQQVYTVKMGGRGRMAPNASKNRRRLPSINSNNQQEKRRDPGERRRRREEMERRKKREGEGARKAVLKARRERDMTQGQKSLRERKKLREKKRREREGSTKRSSEVVNGWMEKKKRTKRLANNSSKTGGGRVVRRKKPVVRARKGVSAPRRDKNRHLQAFHDIKADHARRKDNLVNKLKKSNLRPGISSKYSSLPTSTIKGRNQGGLTRRTTTMPTRKSRSQVAGGGGVKGVRGLRKSTTGRR